jgi:hypothetical protein
MRVSGREYFKGDGNVVVEVAKIEDHDITENLFGHMEDLRGVLDQIPAQHRADAKIDVRAWNDEGGYANATVVISYERPPTSTEIEAERAKKAAEVGGTRQWLRQNIERILEQAREAGIDPTDIGIEVDEWKFVVRR